MFKCAGNSHSAGPANSNASDIVSLQNRSPNFTHFPIKKRFNDLFFIFINSSALIDRHIKNDFHLYLFFIQTDFLLTNESSPGYNGNHQQRRSVREELCYDEEVVVVIVPDRNS